MSDWPDTLKGGPIREWPGEMTRTRRSAPFMRPGKWESGQWKKGTPVPLTQTLADLTRELEKINGKDAVLLVAMRPEDFRNDGRPRANARAEHPGVILSFESSVGLLSYPCDTFTRWEDNLRAIVLSLEALRKVDRYGVTKRGEQYRGFLALESTAMPAGFTSWADAQDFICSVAGVEPPTTVGTDWRALLRIAKRKAHPDTGGDAATFQRVTLAEAKLREAGAL